MAKKVAVVNLEDSMPTAEAAVQRLKNALTSHKGQGCKAVIVIHGYGSTGVGGAIKTAARKCLGESSLRGIVRTYAAGEQWLIRKKELLAVCRDLEKYERGIANNPGVTVVILR